MPTPITSSGAIRRTVLDEASCARKEDIPPRGHVGAHLVIRLKRDGPGESNIWKVVQNFADATIRDRSSGGTSPVMERNTTLSERTLRAPAARQDLVSPPASTFAGASRVREPEITAAPAPPETKTSHPVTTEELLLLLEDLVVDGDLQKLDAKSWASKRGINITSMSDYIRNGKFNLKAIKKKLIKDQVLNEPTMKQILSLHEALKSKPCRYYFDRWCLNQRINPDSAKKYFDRIHSNRILLKKVERRMREENSLNQISPEQTREYHQTRTVLLHECNPWMWVLERNIDPDTCGIRELAMYRWTKPKPIDRASGALIQLHSKRKASDAPDLISRPAKTSRRVSQSPVAVKSTQSEGSREVACEELMQLMKDTAYSPDFDPTKWAREQEISSFSINRFTSYGKEKGSRRLCPAKIESYLEQHDLLKDITTPQIWALYSVLKTKKTHHLNHTKWCLGEGIRPSSTDCLFTSKRKLTLSNIETHMRSNKELSTATPQQRSEYETLSKSQEYKFKALEWLLKHSIIPDPKIFPELNRFQRSR